MAPPMRAIMTVRGLNRYFSIHFPNKSPRMAAGRNARRMFLASLIPAGFRPIRPRSMAVMRFQYKKMMVRMVPP